MEQLSDSQQIGIGQGKTSQFKFLKTLIWVIAFIVLLLLIFSFFKANLTLNFLQLGDRAQTGLPATGEEDLWVNESGDTMYGDLVLYSANLRIGPNNIVTANTEISAEELEILKTELLNKQIADKLYIKEEQFDSIISTMITDGSVSTTDLQNSAITTVKLADGTITTAKILDGSITSAKIADGTIVSIDIADSAIITAKIMDGAVTNVKLADGSVNLLKLSSSMCATGEILKKTSATIWSCVPDTGGGGGAVDSVTAGAGLSNSGTATDPILDVNVDGSTIEIVTDTLRIADGAVTEAKLANNSVTVNKILNGTVTNGKINSSTEFVDVQNSSGVSQFTVTNGDRALQFASSGALSLNFDGVNNRATYGLSSGAGSGLDADLLDGQEGSYYLNATNINAGTLGTGYFSAYSDLTAESYLNNDAGTDLLTRDQSDNRYSIFTTFNAPSGTDPVADAYNDIINFAEGSNITITGNETSDTLTFAVNSTGLNADTLDTIDSASFLRSDASDTYSAGNTLTFAGDADFNGQLYISDSDITFDAANTTFTQTTGDFTFTAFDDIVFNDAQVSNIQLSDIDVTLPNSNVGIIDAINDSWNAAIGSSSGLWLDGGDFAYLNNSFASNIQTLNGSWLGIGSAAERIIFDDTGGDITIMNANAGIGITNPSSLLHVNSTSTADDVVLAKFWSALDGDGEFNSIRVGKNDAVGQEAIFGYRYDTTSGDEGAFITVYGDAINSLYVRKGGNVGIGTTNPGAKLAVAGEINAGTGANQTVFHKGNLILISCNYTWTPHAGGWQNHTWTSGDCGSPTKLPSGYASCMRAISGSDYTYSGNQRLIYCDTNQLRLWQPAGSDAAGRCDFLCWD